ncbi:MAG: hypothetical protein Q9174_003391 [Haloplaca sp. 1 TL-2023]
MEGKIASIALKTVYDEVLLAFEEALDEAENIASHSTGKRSRELATWLDNATTSLISWAVDTRVDDGWLAAVERTPLGFEIRRALLELQQSLGGLMSGRRSRRGSSVSASSGRVWSSEVIQVDHVENEGSMVSMSALVGDLQGFVRPIRMAHASKEGPYRNLKLAVDDIYNKTQPKSESFAGSRTYRPNPAAAFADKGPSHIYDSVGDLLPKLSQSSIASSSSPTNIPSRPKTIAIEHETPTKILQQPNFQSEEGIGDYRQETAATTRDFNVKAILWINIGTALRKNCQEDSHGARFVTPEVTARIMPQSTIRNLFRVLEPLPVQSMSIAAVASEYSKVLAVCLYEGLTPPFFGSLLQCLISDHQLPVGEDFLQSILSSLPEVIDKQDIQRFCAAQWVFLPVLEHNWSDHMPIQDQDPEVFLLQRLSEAVRVMDVIGQSLRSHNGQQPEDSTEIDTASLGVGQAFSDVPELEGRKLRDRDGIGDRTKSASAKWDILVAPGLEGIENIGSPRSKASGK